jgi:hypothetical protein
MKGTGPRGAVSGVSSVVRLAAVLEMNNSNSLQISMIRTFSLFPLLQY